MDEEIDGRLAERVERVEERLTGLEAGIAVGLRTRRVEVVDEAGRVRVVIGKLGPTPDGAVYGLAVLNEHGRHHIWVVSDGLWAEVGLDHEGNTVAAFSVSDTGEPNLFLG